MELKKGCYYRFYGCIILLICFCNKTIAQQNRASTDKNIVHILQKIEKKSDWVFNYDVQKLGEYSFTEPLKKGDIKTQLTHLFYKTPYTLSLIHI